MSTDNRTPEVAAVLPSSRTYRAFESHDRDVATTIVFAIADVEGVDPLELDVTLRDHVDPEALDRLFPADDVSTLDEAHVQLAIAGHDVRVSPTGVVYVDV